MSGAGDDHAARWEASKHAEASWWAVRWGIFRSPSYDRAYRHWALAEIACAAVTLTTLAVALAMVVFKAAGRPLQALEGWPIEILMAAAVGYGTNFLAVQMLFKPREPFRGPLRFFWRQGLIPAKREEMAQIIGVEVATRLLTPDAIAEELVTIAESALDDPRLLESMRVSQMGMLRKFLPQVLERLLPDLIATLREALESTISPQQLRHLNQELLEKWLADVENRLILARFLRDLLKEHSDELTKLMRHVAKRYGKTSTVRSFSVSFGEATAIIDWKKFNLVLRKQLDRPRTMEVAMRIIGDIAGRVDAIMGSVVDERFLVEARTRMGDLAGEAVMRAATDELSARIVGFLEAEGFKRYMREEVIPMVKPDLIAWLRDEGLSALVQRFNVRARVSRAVRQLSNEELEDMANRVGAYHLAAIQVLGYVLGAAAGVLLAAVSI